MSPSDNGAEFGLPADLAGLERQLAERSRGTAPPELRQRVLAALRRESSKLDNRNRRPLRWQWLAASAAAVLVAINFAASVINNMDWRLAEGVASGEIAGAIERVRALAPELSSHEVRRQALLLRAGTRAAPAPYGRSALVRIHREMTAYRLWVATQ
jgi:hypothetical protein